MFEPAEGFRFDIQIRRYIFLGYPLQHVGMGADIFKEPFAGALAELIEIAEILFNKQVGYDEASQPLGLWKALVQLFQAIIADGKEYGRFDGLHDRFRGQLIMKGDL